MHYFKLARIALVVSGMTFLSSCSHSFSDVNSQGKTDYPIFPQASSAVREEGSFVNIENLKQIRPGLTKPQVYELIGVPHFNEGIIRVKEWDYIFHFTQPDKKVLTCQYKILFDTDMIARSFYFMPSNCLSKINNAIEPPAVHKEFSATSLFNFGSETLNFEGIQKVNNFASALKAQIEQGKLVIVTGYADRIGNQEENQKLSLMRAESVKKLLVENGMPRGKIQTRGLGDAMPKVICPGKKSAPVIECLAPNRRITLDVVDTVVGK